MMARRRRDFVKPLKGFTLPTVSKREVIERSEGALEWQLIAT
jgi:hypothetical protein